METRVVGPAPLAVSNGELLLTDRQYATRRDAQGYAVASGELVPVLELVHIVTDEAEGQLFRVKVNAPTMFKVGEALRFP